MGQPDFTLNDKKYVLINPKDGCAWRLGPALSAHWEAGVAGMRAKDLPIQHDKATGQAKEAGKSGHDSMRSKRAPSTWFRLQNKANICED